MQENRRHTVFDDLLVIQCQQRDKKAFDLLVKRWHHKMLRHATRTVKDAETAKDIVQNAWISIAKNIRSLKNPQHFGPWALRIVYNKSIDFLRHQKKQMNTWIPTESEKSLEGQITWVMQKLQELPEKHKLMLSMYYLEEMPVAEIAYVLEIPPGTVKSRLYNARKYFKKQLKNSSHEK